MLINPNRKGEVKVWIKFDQRGEVEVGDEVQPER